MRVPEREIEAVRDLVRAREDARADLMRVRHRLSKLLLRQGIVYYGGTPWTCAHEEWLHRHRFDDIHLKAAFDYGFDAVLAATAARDHLDEQIMEVAASQRFADPVNRLGCLRGISALTGLELTVEIGDWSRFTGSTIGAYVGLVPSEYSSGNSRVQGSITKAGNTHVRRLLIESAWHHRKSYSPSGPSLRARWAKVDPALRTGPIRRFAGLVVDAAAPDMRRCRDPGFARCTCSTENPPLRRSAAHGLGDDVGDGSWLGDQWGMVDIVGMDVGVHAVGHELLGGGVDHAVLFGDQVPGRVVFPCGSRYRMLDALDGNGSLHRRQHCGLFGGPVLSKRRAKGIGR